MKRDRRPGPFEVFIHALDRACFIEEVRSTPPKWSCNFYSWARGWSVPIKDSSFFFFEGNSNIISQFMMMLKSTDFLWRKTAGFLGRKRTRVLSTLSIRWRAHNPTNYYACRIYLYPGTTIFEKSANEFDAAVPCNILWIIRTTAASIWMSSSSGK